MTGRKALKIGEDGGLTQSGLCPGQIMEVAGHQIRYDGCSDWGIGFGMLAAFTILTPGVQTSLLIPESFSRAELEALVLERAALFNIRDRGTSLNI
jgi:hypothetical protein